MIRPAYHASGERPFGVDNAPKGSAVVLADAYQMPVHGHRAARIRFVLRRECAPYSAISDRWPGRAARNSSATIVSLGISML
ncbi:hypothetical protein LPU83_2167 [Rhizobium favelukesii]|uniref:Uncharacterized protein n=1 Tax=Rhizobium favelukesii TaxID=348824 RepID=W6RA69_9HYPH|nr:hypothetical protein LPU83_2167 [Rhizobium favelukesii]